MLLRASRALALVLIGLLALRVTMVWADVTFNPDDDTYVKRTDPSANFDESAAPTPGPISVTSEQSGAVSVPNDHGYLRFDLTGWSGTVTSARLRLWEFGQYGPSITIGVYNPGSDDWNGGSVGIGDETTLTYNNAPSPGGGTLLDSQVGSTSVGWMEFSGASLTSYVNSELAGDGIVTFLLRASSPDIAAVAYYEDRENTQGTGNPPELILEGDLPVEVEGLRASRVYEGVRLEWRTLSEHKNAGFRVLREASGGTMVELTPSLLRPERSAGELGGAAYSFVDRQAPIGSPRYWIEDVDITGVTTRHGPVTAPRAEIVPAEAPSIPIGQMHGIPSTIAIPR